MDAAGATEFRTAINGLVSGGWTNWEDGGLFKSSGAWGGFSQKPGATNSPAPNTRPDMVVMITDGNPNTTRSSTAGEFGDGSADAVNPAIVQANSMKNRGAHMFVIGVGSAVTNPADQAAIQAISDTEPFNAAGTNLRTADNMFTSDWAKLKADLQRVVSSFCASIDKSVSPTTAVAPGAKLSYSVTITSKVPDLGPTLTDNFTDTLPSGVTLDKTSVKIGGVAVTEDNSATPGPARSSYRDPC